LPNLIVIGAQKCGTTSLHYYLGLHPQVAMSGEKELDFFTLEHNWPKGIGWYRSQFTGPGLVHGETSPRYTYYPFYEGVASRMHAVVPQAKLIYIVRDPIERIIAGYVHSYAQLKEHRPIEEALAELDSNPYVCRSQYTMQLEQYLRFYSPSRILVLSQEDMLHRRGQVMGEAFGFLGVDDTFHSPGFVWVKHPTKLKRRLTARGKWLAETRMMRAVEHWPYRVREKVKALVYFPFSRAVPRPVLAEPLRRALIEFLRDDIDRFRAWTGREFSAWSI
jgi:hypothetical protein